MILRNRLLFRLVTVCLIIYFYRNGLVEGKAASSNSSKRRGMSKGRRAKKNTKVEKSSISRSSAATISLVEELDPFQEMARYLVRLPPTEDIDFRSYSIEEIRKALSTLSKSQSALKSMDGATHQFRNVFKESSSLGSRFEKFLRKKRKNMKEAAKVYEYTRAVERGMQACEMIQCVAHDKDDERAALLKETGLVEMHRFTVSRNKVTCVVTVLKPRIEVIAAEDAKILGNQTSPESFTTREDIRRAKAADRMARSTPRRFYADELIVVITEEQQFSKPGNAIAQLLRLMMQEPVVNITMARTARLTASNASYNDFTDDTTALKDENILTVQPTLLALAHDVLASIKDDILHQTQSGVSNDEEFGNKRNSGTEDFDTSNDENGWSDFEDDLIVRKSKYSKSWQQNEKHHARVVISASDKKLPGRIRFIGHSAGGAVAAISAMILDGSLDGKVLSWTDQKASSTLSKRKNKRARGRNSKRQSREDEHTKEDEDSLEMEAKGLFEGIRKFTGTYCNRVSSLTLGSPPCVGRAMVPKFITSLVCGDDMVPRAQKSALSTFSKRTMNALKSGAGKGSIGYIMGAGFLRDLSSVAGKGLKHYKGAKKYTTDARSLNVPGRVFFMKPRKLKEGATMQRVLRGNWQEDMLWQLHDILISKRMMEHHSLHSYIRTLSRC